MKKIGNKDAKTSWGDVAEWYDEHLEGNADSYHVRVIAPNLLRVLDIKKNDTVLDIACGQGFFTRMFAEAGGTVEGSDVSYELIAKAKKHSPLIDFYVASAHALSFAQAHSYDIATIVLAIQNIESIGNVFAEVHRVLKPNGRLILVMNHPAFRAPKRTSWGWDESAEVQYRRVDGYLSSATIPIDMHPGTEESEQTISYHRSLQEYFKALAKSGFAVTKLEEWISHKKSERGPRQVAEDTARKEIPLFMMIECRVITL